MKRLLTIMAFLAGFWFAAAPAHANQETTIPFEVNDEGLLIVGLTLNGDVATDAIFDTGATFPILGHHTAARIGLVTTSESATVDIVGIGLQHTFPVASVNDVGLGPLSLGAMKTAYGRDFDVHGTDTVIPARLLPHRTLDFDFEESRLTAYDRRPARVFKSTTSKLPVTWINSLPFVEVKVNGVEGLALIDTGASNTFINSAFARGAAQSPKSFRTVEVIGSTGNVTPLRILSSRRFKLGDFEVSRFDVIVIDPAFLEACGLTDRPVMVLGLDILRQFRVQLDRGSDQIHLSKKLPRPDRLPGMYLGSTRRF